MNKNALHVSAVRHMKPLLRSIAREFAERTRSVRGLEGRMAELCQTPRPDRDELRRVAAEAAAHYRGLRLARREIEGLGCSVVGTAPLTVCVPTRVAGNKKSLLFQFADTAL